MDKPHIYKITNKLNGKFYYGVHNGKHTDSYMGSGKLLKLAQNKNGIENFSKEILLWFDTEEEAYEYEGVIVNQKMVDDPMCYNIMLGGKGSMGREHTEEAKEKISKANKGENNYWHGKKLPEEVKQKISKAIKGKKVSKETKKKMSDAKKGIAPKTSKIKVKCPHCEKEGQKTVMHRWHFDNCKRNANKKKTSYPV